MSLKYYKILTNFKKELKKNWNIFILSHTGPHVLNCQGWYVLLLPWAYLWNSCQASWTLDTTHPTHLPTKRLFVLFVWVGFFKEVDQSHPQLYVLILGLHISKISNVEKVGSP